jgi:MFS family permease
MRAFVAIWAGQLVSLLGTAATGFGLAVWVYQRTGDVGDLALIAVALFLPQVVLAPYGGVLADRMDRRRLMIAADCGSAAATAALLGCAAAGLLSPWTAALLVAASSSCNALQWPAFEAALVALVPPAQLGRANGMCELSRGLSQLAAPLVAGAMFGLIGIEGIIAFDLASFAVGLVPLLLIRIPARHRDGDPATVGQLWRDLVEAARLVKERRGLVAMLVLFSATNFTFAVVELLLKPVVLSFGSPFDLGLVLSTVGIGMVVGSIAMTAWGGPRRRVLAILLFQLVEGAALLVGGARPSLVLICAGAFAYGLVIPLTFGCARTIWQLKVPHALQGRVSALRNAVIMLAIPLGYAAATPMANLLEPLLAADGALAGSLGELIGVGPGRGSAAVVIAMGLVTWAAAIAAFAFRPYRRVEVEVDDLLVPSAAVDAS